MVRTSSDSTDEALRMAHDERVFEILGQAKRLAQEYRALTQKPLGITGEVAEYEAARLLNLELTPARHAGYDAVRPGDGRRYQIKGRCTLPGCKPGQRVGSIDIRKEFDAVVLVLLDENFDAVEIHEVDRESVLAALKSPGSKARNERGALSISKFKRIGERVWCRETGHTQSTVMATNCDGAQPLGPASGLNGSDADQPQRVPASTG